MAEGPETRLVKKIRRVIEDRYPGSYTYKQHGGAYSQVGFPDLLVVIEGHAIFFEVKAPRPGESDAAIMARVTAIQNETLRRLRAAGAIAEVIWSEDQALEVLGRLMPRQTSQDWQTNARLYALADQEDKLRHEVEELEELVCKLRAENDRIRRANHP